MGFRVVLIVTLLVVAAGSCGEESGDSTATPETTGATGEVATTEIAPTSVAAGAAVDSTPPWGLDEIEMPDAVPDVETALAALPSELGGAARVDVPGRFDGAYSVEYGETRAIKATPISAVAAAMDQEMTALEWMEIMAGALEGEVEGTSLDADAALAWFAAAEEASGVTAHIAGWCAPDGSWYFDVVADTSEARLELVQAFIAAVGQM